LASKRTDHHEHGMVATTILRDFVTAQNVNRTVAEGDEKPSQDDPAMTSENPAQRYRREAAECQRNAKRAMRVADREAWLRLAEDWTKLARGADLNQERQTMQAPPPSSTRHH